ncbi:MAG: hypothetical protein HC901_02345 [Bdellovibrionaceae bacterium]|nr:hypothetical protein [Pseudobdellovibrionaceae bacterium]
MIKKMFGGAVAALLIGALAGGNGRAEAAAQKPMNVLFLVVDDLNTWLLSDPNRYTGKVIAPNIQRLASEGMLFRATTALRPSVRRHGHRPFPALLHGYRASIRMRRPPSCHPRFRNRLSCENFPEKRLLCCNDRKGQSWMGFSRFQAGCHPARRWIAR